MPSTAFPAPEPCVSGAIEKGGCAEEEGKEDEDETTPPSTRSKGGGKKTSPVCVCVWSAPVEEEEARSLVASTLDTEIGERLSNNEEETKRARQTGAEKPKKKGLLLFPWCPKQNEEKKERRWSVEAAILRNVSAKEERKKKIHYLPCTTATTAFNPHRRRRK